MSGDWWFNLRTQQVEQGQGDPNAEDAPVKSAALLGMTLSELTDEAREQFGISKDVSGVVITEVAPDSPAGEKGVNPGDVIAEIAQESVATPKDALDRVNNLKGQGRKSALLMLNSKDGEIRFVPLPIDR